MDYNGEQSSPPFGGHSRTNKLGSLLILREPIQNKKRESGSLRITRLGVIYCNPSFDP